MFFFPAVIQYYSKYYITHEPLVLLIEKGVVLLQLRTEQTEMSEFSFNLKCIFEFSVFTSVLFVILLKSSSRRHTNTPSVPHTCCGRLTESFFSSPARLPASSPPAVRGNSWAAGKRGAQGAALSERWESCAVCPVRHGPMGMLCCFELRPSLVEFGPQSSEEFSKNLFGCPHFFI